MDDATALIERLEWGETTSEALLDELVARVEAQRGLNAVVAMDVEGARRRAREADLARGRGESWGPLHGLPLTLKDSWEAVGMTATSGLPEWRDHRPDRNADAVQRIVDAGGIPFGKTNLPLLAGEWQSFNPVYGTTNNPWDPSRTPGGSSGGAAASLAAGLTPLELGSDLGGSIRIPAHFCGVYGHKPTHGLVPLRGHLPGPPGTQSEPDLAVAGPMARSARDLQLLFDVVAGARADEAGWTLDLPSAPARELSDLRVAVWLDDPDCPLEADVRTAIDAAVGRLSDAGARIRRVERRLEPIVEPYLRLLAALVGAGMPAKTLRRVERAGRALRLLWRVWPPPRHVPTYLDALSMSHRDWLKAHEQRLKLRAEWATWFEDVDVLLMPVTPWAAFPHAHKGQIVTRRIEVPSGKRPYVEHLWWIALATLLGLPATSVPVGRTEGGLPVGMQIVGPRFGDRRCLAFAAEMERVVGGFVAPP